VLLRIVFRIYEAEDRAEVCAAVEEQLLATCGALLRQFVADVPKEARDSWVPLVVLLLRELQGLSDERVGFVWGSECVSLCAYIAHPFTYALLFFPHLYVTVFFTVSLYLRYIYLRLCLSPLSISKIILLLRFAVHKTFFDAFYHGV
jgi:hypothetical protein